MSSSSDTLRHGDIMWAYWQMAASMAQPSLDEIRDSAGWLALSTAPSNVRVEACAVGAVRGLVATPTGARDDLQLLCLHGGGFISGSSESHSNIYGHMAAAAGRRAIILDYPLAPEQPFPAAVDACLAAYRQICDTIDPHKLFLVGDSAGGNLAVSICQRAASLGLPAPAGIVLFSPWLDLSLGSPSLDGKRSKDPFFHKERLHALLDAYLPADQNRADPLVSPLFGDLSRLPPLYLQAGADEGLLDDSVRFAKAVRDAGSSVKIDIFPEMPHAFQATVGRDARADAAIGMAASWIAAQSATPL